MASNLKVQRIIPPYLGLDTDSAPEVIAPERAPNHYNLLLDRPGAAVMRGPLIKVTSNTGTAEATVADPLIGVFPLDDTILFTQSNGGASARVAPWESFWKYAASDAELLQSNNTNQARSVMLKTPFTEQESVITAGPDNPWGTGTPLANVLFAPSVQGDAAGSVVANHRRYDTGVVHVVNIAGGLSTARTFTAANRPGYVIATKAHYQRLFVCAAQDGTGFSTFGGYTTDYNPHQIYWTNPVTSVTALISTAATSWRDPVSLQINKATVGNPDSEDACMALAHQERNLVIFKRNSVFVLYGYGNATWNIRQVADNIGCVDPRSVVEVDGDVYFMSQQGFMHYDGIRFRNVSGRLRSSLVETAIRRVGPGGADGGGVWASVHRDGYILVTTFTMNYQTGVSDVGFCGYYCPATDSWSRFRSDAVAAYDNWENSSIPGSLLGFANTANHVIGYTTDCFYNAKHLFFPEGSPGGKLGLDESATNAANLFGTTAGYVSRLQQLASPIYQTKLQAVLLDYAVERNAGAEDASNDTFVTIKNGSGDTLLAQTGIGSMGAASAKTRRRWQKDVFTETANASDVSVTVDMVASVALNEAKTFALDILYQPAQERRSS